jgi:hypothetical protein
LIDVLIRFVIPAITALNPEQNFGGLQHLQIDVSERTLWGRALLSPQVLQSKSQKPPDSF